MTSILLLPQNIINHIALYLTPIDLFQFGSCSKALCNKVLNYQELWKNKAIRDFGDLFKLYQIFTSSTGLELPSDITQKFDKEPQDWKPYYITKMKSMQESDKEVLIRQANKEYQDSKLYLRTFKDDINYSIFMQFASKMLWMLDAFPNPGGYYIFAYMLFIMKRLESALDVIDMGRGRDPAFEAFNELENQILHETEYDMGAADDVPVLINDNLSPELLNVLFELFHQYDKDRDDCLNPQELDSFVFNTNGQHPPTEFIEQMGARFGANEKGWLTKKGFLNFYLEQTLGDPSETRNDIRAHGYDGGKLILITQ